MVMPTETNERSHGKGRCDGIGSPLRELGVRASLEWLRYLYTPWGLFCQTIYPRGTIPREGYVGNYAPDFATFLSDSQWTPWRDILFRMRETFCIVCRPRLHSERFLRG